ncbi:RICIN domain-containing protein [Streptomyces cinerochromogenes]|uniref:RICIN domain-containing protein n=1 Tax=Streptomyces cinerochromogenes TaxID=66422 RepID=A0ABW7B2T7_9ACTN
MTREDHRPRRRTLRSVTSAAAGAVLFAGALVGLGSGTASAASAITGVSTSGLTMRAVANYSTAIDKPERTNPSLADRNLTNLAGTGASGKAGVCFPTPFNPGVDADGYCWNNAGDDSGSNGWAPQGFSVPHTAAGDGVWDSHRWEVTSWHHGTTNDLAKLRFTNRDTATPTYFDVLLVVPGTDGSVQPQSGNHADGVVWYEKRLLVAHGRYLDVFDLDDLKYDSDKPNGFSYVLPVRYTYRTTATADAKDTCAVASGTEPCLNGISFDREHTALTTNEFLDGSGARIIRWDFDTATGLPKADSGTAPGDATADAAWSSPVWKMQGVVQTGGTFYISGACPSSFDNSYREPACVHKGAVDAAPSVLTQVPDMAQNVDWDASTGRIRGVNEVAQADQTNPQRLVFDFHPTARPLTTVRLRNVNSGRCLTPYGASLNDGANIVQWECNGRSGENWYWNGSEIRSFLSDRCLTVYGSSTSNGANAVQWTCNGSAAQKWTRASGAGGGSVLVNGNSGKCLTIYGAGVGDGAQATQWTCDSTDPAHAWIGYTP